MFARERILEMLADGRAYRLKNISETIGITRPYSFVLLRELVNEDIVEKVKRGTYRIINPDKEAVAKRTKDDILIDLANIKDEIGLVEWKIGHL